MPDRTAQFARLDELLAKIESDLTEEDWTELENFAGLLADPEYQAHRRALLVAAAEKAKH